jgi:hypothetical protein
MQQLSELMMTHQRQGETLIERKRRWMRQTRALQRFLVGLGILLSLFLLHQDLRMLQATQTIAITQQQILLSHVETALATLHDQRPAGEESR